MAVYMNKCNRSKKPEVDDLGSSLTPKPWKHTRMPVWVDVGFVFSLATLSGGLGAENLSQKISAWLKGILLLLRFKFLCLLITVRLPRWRRGWLEMLTQTSTSSRQNPSICQKITNWSWLVTWLFDSRNWSEFIHRVMSKLKFELSNQTLETGEKAAQGKSERFSRVAWVLSGRTLGWSVGRIQQLWANVILRHDWRSILVASGWWLWGCSLLNQMSNGFYIEAIWHLRRCCVS